MSLFRMLWVAGFLIVLGSTAFGDIAPGRSPLPKPPMVAPVRIEKGPVDDLSSDVVAKIVIPSSLLPDLKEPAYGTQTSGATDFRTVGTIMAGLAISALVVSLMFAVKKSPHRKRWMLSLIGCVLFVTLMLLANAFLPGQFSEPSVPPSASQSKILIEIQKGGHEVVLVLPSHN